MSLIQNERTKLTATYLNGIAVAIFGVGVLAPAVTNFSNWDGSSHVVSFAIAGIALISSIAIHFVARKILKGLIP
ncbi:hypothetical protein [Beijerinckia mobilis]|uniref:hypothetical protein n=1 Tax=Beijerinckia mobilis TaxID=231434 RepID=UPI00054E3743|nr:hypothetical protein [Beijerinckia mobilis]